MVSLSKVEERGDVSPGIWSGQWGRLHSTSQGRREQVVTGHLQLRPLREPQQRQQLHPQVEHGGHVVRRDLFLLKFLFVLAPLPSNTPLPYPTHYRSAGHAERLP